MPLGLIERVYKNESIYGEITIKTNSLEISPLIRIRAKEYKDGKD